VQVITVQQANNTPILCIEDVPSPQLRDGQVLIDVTASGINRADIFQKQGQYRAPQGESNILGLEVSGVVRSSKAKNSDINVGDKVCALLAGGGYASQVVVDEACVLPIPDSVALLDAAGIMEVCATVWLNIFDIANMSHGETLLVHGGTSGVGTMAILIAKSYGIDCYSTCGDDDKCTFAERLGAKCAINYHINDFQERLLDVTNGKGVDVILDIVGGPYLSRHIKLLKPNGRLVCISVLGGKEGELNMASLLMKNLHIMGSTLRHKTVEQKQHILAQLYKNIWPLFENGKVKPVIDRIFPADQANQAHEYMASGQHKGKILLQW